jgi:translation initiation factor 2-alpha kinase 4
VSASEPTGVVGTKMYTAPEIEQGLPHNAKVDMYSLGIIAFELLCRFTTGMERIVVLNELREKKLFPASFLAQHPPASAATRLITWLLEADPAKRPSAGEVLHRCKSCES